MIKTKPKNKSHQTPLTSVIVFLGPHSQGMLMTEQEKGGPSKLIEEIEEEERALDTA